MKSKVSHNYDTWPYSYNGRLSDSVNDVTRTPQLKLKNMVTTQQERLLGERETALQRQKHELDAVRDSLAQKQDEVRLWCACGGCFYYYAVDLSYDQVRKLEGALEENRQRLEESKEQLKTDENGTGYSSLAE